MTFTQISRRQGMVKRVRPGAEPVVKLDLDPGQYVAGFEMREAWPDPDRKTTDYYWTAYIVTPLPATDG